MCNLIFLWDAAVLLLLRLEITVHPPDSTLRRCRAACTTTGATSTTKFLCGNADSSLSRDESTVERLLERARFDLLKSILGSKSADTSACVDDLLKTCLLRFVCTDPLVDLLESKAGLGDLGVLLALGHGARDEVSGVSEVLVLVKEVLEHGNATVKVDIDLLAELLLALDGRDNLSGVGELVLVPLGVGGLFPKVADKFVEAETNVKVDIKALFVLVDEADTLGFHIRGLHDFPRDGEDKLGLGANLSPVRVEKGNALLVEGAGCDCVKVLERLGVELFNK